MVETTPGVFTITLTGGLAGTGEPQITGTITNPATIAGTTLAGAATETHGGGSVLELGNTTTAENAGLETGLTINTVHLVLNGSGDPAFNDQGAVTVLSGNSPITGPFGDPIVPTDNLWNGLVTLDSSSTIDVTQAGPPPGTTTTSSRLVIQGVIGDGALPQLPANLTLTGGGELDLLNANTYRGTTFVNQGVLTAENSQALGGEGVAPVQTLALTNAIKGTTFSLTFGSATTGPITFNNSNGSGANTADAVAIQNALMSLATIGDTAAGGLADVGGTASVFQQSPGVWQITLGGSLVGLAQPQITATVINNPTGKASFSEVQTVTVTDSVLNAPLQFTLTFNGNTTAPITFTGTAADANGIQTALNNLLIAQGVNAAVAVTAVSTSPGSSGVFSITFSGSLAGFNQQQITGQIPAGLGAGTVVGTTGTAGTGGTVVANGASLQLSGGISINGEPLLVQGTGATNSSNVPTQWFQVGPAPIQDGEVDAGGGAADSAVSGRVTGVAIDPLDANVIYIGTSGGGAWKTIDGGKTWRPIFDAIPNIQTITNTATVGQTFNLTVTLPGIGASTTGAILFTGTSADAADIQSALDSLTNISNAGGYVTVTQSGNVFTVTFSNNLGLATLANPAATIVMGDSRGTVNVVEQGMAPEFTMNIGAIAMDPNNPNVIYLGTGEADNSSDSYFGTGVYVSRDAGVTWSPCPPRATTPSTPWASRRLPSIRKAASCWSRTATRAPAATAATPPTPPRRTSIR